MLQYELAEDFQSRLLKVQHIDVSPALPMIPSRLLQDHDDQNKVVVTDGPYEEGGKFGIRWQGHPNEFIPSQRMLWRIIKLMWPPVENKECSALEIKRNVCSTTEKVSWAKNKSSLMKKALRATNIPFEIDSRKTMDSEQLFVWRKISE